MKIIHVLIILRYSGVYKIGHGKVWCPYLPSEFVSALVSYFLVMLSHSDDGKAIILISNPPT